MKKNGFVFIETLIVMVVLTSSLLLLYTSFNRVLQLEKIRIQYDDVNYIYRTWYVKRTLDHLNINMPIRELERKTSTGKGIYFVTIGEEYDGLFEGVNDKKTFFHNMINDFNVNQIILLNTRKIDNIKKCSIECANTTTCDEYDNCNQLYTNLSDDMIDYLNSLNVSLDSVYLLVIEFRECNSSNICHNYYGWVGV